MLKGKIAVVTGGQGRLGPIWIDTLEKAGARVFVLDLPAYDVSKLDQVYEFQQMLPPDQVPTIVVNSAAIGGGKRYQGFYARNDKSRRRGICQYWKYYGQHWGRLPQLSRRVREASRLQSVEDRSYPIISFDHNPVWTLRGAGGDHCLRSL